MEYNVEEILERMLAASDYLIPDNLKKLHCDERITSRGKNTGEAIHYTGQYCYGFRLKNEKNVTQYCLRLWKSDINKNDRESAVAISKVIKRLKDSHKLDCFVNFDYIGGALRLDEEDIPGLLMEWGGETLSEVIYPKGNDLKRPTSKQYRLLADNFYNICRKMKEVGVVHGDLSALNILIDQDWKIKLIDYDSLYIPSMDVVGSQFNLGTGGFQHPGRLQATKNTMADDNFSQLIVYISLLAYSHGIEFIDKEGNTGGKRETLLFSEAELKTKSTFVDAPAYKAIKATGDAELLFYLDALEKAFDVPYDHVPFLCDLHYEPKEKPMPQVTETKDIVMAGFCGRCGHHFLNQTDLFCPDCGKKRETL